MADGAGEAVVVRLGELTGSPGGGELDHQDAPLVGDEPPTPASVPAGQLGAVDGRRDRRRGQVGQRGCQLVEGARRVAEHRPRAIVHPHVSIRLDEPSPSGAVGQPLESIE